MFLFIIFKPNELEEVMKTRTISAAILIAILTPAIIIGKIPFAIMIGLIVILATIEINNLNKYPLIIKIITFISLISLVYSNFDYNSIKLGINYNVINLIILLFTIPVIFYQVSEKYTIKDAFKLIGFVLLIGIGLSYFILIRTSSLKYFLYMLLIPIFTDTFAYVGGSLIGKHKVTKISPKKSLEGYIIGSIMGTFIMTMYYITFINVQSNIFIIIGITLALTIIGQVGDLFFSAIKREYKIKDFANLIPGHGGVLDRLDSLLFVVIAFMSFMQYL